MSRIGNTPVTVPTDVQVHMEAGRIKFTGPKGELTVLIPDGIKVAKEDQVMTATRTRNDKRTKSGHGLVVASMKNAVTGVTTGWTKKLELQGVGYRVAVSGANLTLNVGFSHPVTIVPPAGITFTVVDGKIVVSGIDKYIVGQTAATIRDVKPPEPYKGKGIRYVGEYVRKKAGKSAKAVGGGPGAK